MELMDGMKAKTKTLFAFAFYPSSLDRSDDICNYVLACGDPSLFALSGYFGMEKTNMAMTSRGEDSEERHVGKFFLTLLKKHDNVKAEADNLLQLIPYQLLNAGWFLDGDHGVLKIVEELESKDASAVNAMKHIVRKPRWGEKDAWSIDDNDRDLIHEPKYLTRLLNIFTRKPEVRAAENIAVSGLTIRIYFESNSNCSTSLKKHTDITEKQQASPTSRKNSRFRRKTEKLVVFLGKHKTISSSDK